MQSSVKSLCAVATGLAMAWGAATPVARADTIDHLTATFTPTENLSDAAFLYTSNSSPGTSVSSTVVQQAAVPLGDLTAGTPYTFSFDAVDTGNGTIFPYFAGDFVSTMLLGVNDNGGLSVGINSGTTVGTFTNTLGTAAGSEQDVIDALGSPGTPDHAATLFALFGNADVQHVDHPLHFFLPSMTIYTLVDFPSPDHPDDVGVAAAPFTVTIMDAVAVPLPASAVMGLPALAGLAVVQRRRRRAAAE